MQICHVSDNVDAQMKRSIGVAMRRCVNSFCYTPLQTDLGFTAKLTLKK